MSLDKECPSLEMVNERVKDLENKQYQLNGDVRELSGSMRDLKESLDTTNKNFEKSNEKQDKTNDLLFELINGFKSKEEKDGGWNEFLISNFKKAISWLIASIFIALIGLILLNAKALFPHL